MYRFSDIGYEWLERVVCLAGEKWEVLGYADVTLRRDIGAVG